MASQYPGSCMSASSIRITSLVNIAAFLVRQTVVLLWNYFSEDNDPYFMIILSRIRVDEEMIDRVTVTNDVTLINNVSFRVADSLKNPSPKVTTLDTELLENHKLHHGIRLVPKNLIFLD